ncbi:MAG: RT0821/Lpp0805 family surface protein [Myxococcota bacterium]
MQGRFWHRIGVAVMLLPFLVSCASIQESYGDNPKAVLGSLGGAAAGAGIAALAGGSTGWIVAGGLIGGLAGGAIGKKLDDKDKQKAAAAAHEAFESNRTGQSSTWTNPDSGNRGEVTPTRTYQLADGQYCREYTQDIYIGGEKHESYGTACRQADGSWKIQS